MARDWPDARGIWYGLSIFTFAVCAVFSFRSLLVLTWSCCELRLTACLAWEDRVLRNGEDRVLRNWGVCVYVCLIYKYNDVSKMCRNASWFAKIMHEKNCKKKIASYYLTLENLFHAIKTEKQKMKNKYWGCKQNPTRKIGYECTHILSWLTVLRRLWFLFLGGLLWHYQKEPRSKCWGAAAQYGCTGKIYTANIWNLYRKHVELQVKSFIKCHMILVESIRRKNPLVSNKAESYHGWIIVILPEEWERLCSCWAETWHEGWSGCYSSFCQSNIILQYLCRHSEEIRTI